ncbi:nicotinamidase-like isoform X3 [Mya arenaria]|uniref:nicotinamidase-like isoform X3 n=1 Tax=Mya arenaria TaxID=6604 RepID=UPI0022DEB8F0|nr:nicotinamidase-like isoform X3 [Mya arenaria]
MYMESVMLAILLVLSAVGPALSNLALIIIDVQNCFLSGGTLAVENGDDVISVIQHIRLKYKDQISLTVFTQDWHCADHVSFASQHVGKQPFTAIDLLYTDNGTLCPVNSSCDSTHNISQTLWPDHCVINTTDAQLSSQLEQHPGDIVVKKGYHCQVDSYSGFFDNGGFSHTELDSLLRQRKITRLLVTGLALDFCVYYTSKDGQALGYETYTVADACRPVRKDNVDSVLQDLRTKVPSPTPVSEFPISAGPALKSPSNTEYQGTVKLLTSASSRP